MSSQAERGNHCGKKLSAAHSEMFAVKKKSGGPKGCKLGHLLGEKVSGKKLEPQAYMCCGMGVWFLHSLHDIQIFSKKKKKKKKPNISLDFEALEPQEEQKQKHCIKMEFITRKVC